jgi:hypothetical protein
VAGPHLRPEHHRRRWLGELIRTPGADRSPDAAKTVGRTRAPSARDRGRTHLLGASAQAYGSPEHQSIGSEVHSILGPITNGTENTTTGTCLSPTLGGVSGSEMTEHKRSEQARTRRTPLPPPEVGFQVGFRGPGGRRPADGAEVGAEVGRTSRPRIR